MFNVLSTGYRLTQICRNDNGANGYEIVDLSLYTALHEFIFERPDGTTLAVTTTLTSDGKDGSMYYDTPANFFSYDGGQPAYGRWRFRPHIKASASQEFYGDWVSFEVGD